ncbi:MULTISPECIES: restriction endonuclease subunit S [Vibrio]|uniref:restriction endonuclease subunit S n=1 Tax=Vibrio TaxID=662 RepID=UPI00021A980F|nr:MULTISPECIES: restriction endonuclease subunit S [Vibrio]EGS60819.1 type I restriction modification DNA specificity domain protein [Vibrio paracholerae HE-09]MEB5598427.1 restriction endonuclease subunit S [Vibrio cholerae]TXY57358.1 restriction endonuclease subunit S [Vibrio cholerae]TXZ30443.1 restriction endonuclease subunit S [Vibrio cholerae]GHW21777.1 Type I restriction-modification system, specificity subunit S [Vibrio cholerae]
MARSLAKDSIPSGWKYGLLDKFATRCSGHTPSKSFPEYWDGGIKWISLADSFRLDQGYVYETEKEISEAGIANSSAELHPAETVVLSRDAGIGKSGVMAEPMAVSQHFIAWKCDNSEKLNSWFLYNWLQLNKAEFERQAVGSTIKTIGLPYFKKLKIAVPPYSEQKKIAKILSTWDKAIATSEQLLANSKQQKKALMQQLLTGKKRLLDKNGVRFSGEWKRVELGDLLDYQQPTPYLVESTEYSDDFPTPVLTAGKTFILGYTDEESGIFSEQLPAIIFDDFTTDSKFVDFPFKAKSSAMKILTSKDGVSIRFVYEAMQLLDFAVGGHQRHWISIYSRLVIPFPVKEEQQKIAAVLSTADQEISTLQQKLEALKQEKKALMQQLLTGKRRVNIN